MADVYNENTLIIRKKNSLKLFLSWKEDTDKLACNGVLKNTIGPEKHHQISTVGEGKHFFSSSRFICWSSN